MTTERPPESDWRIFREISPLALDRFCSRVLDELDAIRTDASRITHERYVDIFQLLTSRDRELARAFDDPRRSRMIQQLAAMQSLGVLEPREVSRLSAGTRAALESFSAA